MTLYLILARVIGGVKIHLVRGWSVMVKLRRSGLMDWFMAEVRLGWRWSCWRRSLRARWWARIVATCWTRSIRLLLCWVGRTVECCSRGSLGPRGSGWSVIILRVEIKQPTKTVGGLCLEIIILK